MNMTRNQNICKYIISRERSQRMFYNMTSYLGQCSTKTVELPLLPAGRLANKMRETRILFEGGRVCSTDFVERKPYYCRKIYKPERKNTISQ